MVAFTDKFNKVIRMSFEKSVLVRFEKDFCFSGRIYILLQNIINRIHFGEKSPDKVRGVYGTEKKYISKYKKDLTLMF